MGVVEAWSTEYIQKGIPSSFREEPSGTVRYFLEFLLKKHIKSGCVLDLGAGRGRNSFYLAQHGFSCKALDFVSSNISYITEEARQRGLDVEGVCRSVTEPWLFESASFDIAMDIFCYKHQTSDESRARYRRELANVLRPGGMFLISLAGDDDGYYGPLLSSSPNPADKLVIDPMIGIESNLYNRADLEVQFAEDFKVIDFQHKHQTGPMHGGEYMRSTLMFIMQRKG